MDGWLLFSIDDDDEGIAFPLTGVVVRRSVAHVVARIVHHVVVGAEIAVAHAHRG